MSHNSHKVNPDINNKRGFFQRLLGKCVTQLPSNSDCWSFANGTLAIDLSKAPELAKLGAAIRIEDDSLPERILLVHGEDDEYHAYKNVCLHGKRRIDPVAGAGTIQCCSVGKTTYGYDGKTLRGPVEGELTVYPIVLKEQKVTISFG